jgi:hypothetical protein
VALTGGSSVAHAGPKRGPSTSSSRVASRWQWTAASSTCSDRATTSARIAAIDWGRDFSYGRTATETATEPTRLLAFPASALRELMADAPEVDREMRRIAHARLASR